MPNLTDQHLLPIKVDKIYTITATLAEKYYVI